MLVPYQLMFFSSGAREEGFERGALTELRVNVWIGYGVGTLFAVALVVLGAVLYEPRGIEVHRLHQVLAMPRAAGLGASGEAVMGVGMVVAMAGAAFETALATGYMTAQYRGWSWSMDHPVRRASRFFAVTLGTLVVAGLVMTVGVDVVALTDWSLVLSTVALPLTYGPVWLAARDRRRMGRDRSGPLVDVLGAASLVVVVVVAVVAVPALAVGG
jgi:Mn2+/Fe2+ NRAMP family transporter